ncbi:MAG TPA: TonB-dependent siderophore receptor [Roseimicrobium sp.]|nr:TonB-dependent siderophore receptor [Roseimicrobium sp.]
MTKENQTAHAIPSQSLTDRRPALFPSAATLALANAILMAGAAHGQSTNSPAATVTPPAKTPTTSTNATTQLPEVVVTGQATGSNYKPETVSSPKYTQPLNDIPQTITVIPKAVFEEQGATSLRDILRNVPGISMQAGEGGVPSGDNLSIRGFNARTDMFIDGVRDFGGYSRDPFNLEQVEVTKGPASSNAGRGSTGGSINLVSKMPHLDPSYSGSAGYGTEDYKRFTGDLNQPVPGVSIEGVALRLNGMWQASGVANRDEVENERWGVSPSVAFGLGTPTRVIASYFHLDQDNVPDYGIPWVPAANTALPPSLDDKPAPVPYSNYYGILKRDFEKTRTDIGSLLVEHDFGDSLRARNQFRYGQTMRDSVYTSPRFVANNSTAINRQFQSRDQLDTVLANQTDLTWETDAGNLHQTLVGGTEVAYETSKNFARTAPAAPPATLLNPNPNAPYAGTVTRTGAYTETKSSSLAFYLFDTVKLTEKWEVTGGLRWDSFKVDYTSVAVGGAQTKLGRLDNMVSGRGGIVYKPRPNGTIYASYGTSFNPSAEGLTLASTATAANNVGLAPEESQTFEIGTKWELFDRRLSLNAAIFRTSKNNARTEDPADPTDTVVLSGQQRVDGIEIGAVGSLTDDWKVFGGYTLMSSEIASSQNPLEVGKKMTNTPEQSFSLWTTYRLPFGMEIGGGAQFVDVRYANTTNTREAPGYVLFDALVSYEVNKHLTMRLNVYNLADEEYLDRVGGGHVIPGAGRSAVLTANFKF